MMHVFEVVMWPLSHPVELVLAPCAEDVLAFAKGAGWEIQKLTRLGGCHVPLKSLQELNAKELERAEYWKKHGDADPEAWR
jgi:hypothetical protein